MLATTINPADPAAVKSLAAMRAAMLTLADVGIGYTQKPLSEDPLLKAPRPCGGLSPDDLYPNPLSVSLEADKATNAVLELLELLPNAAAAEKEFSSIAGGMNCAKGTIGQGDTIMIGKPRDVTSQVGGTKAIAWDISINASTGVIIVTKVGFVVASYWFYAANVTPTASLPDPVAVAKRATARIFAAAIR